jgi:hypothetical protein
MCEDNRYFWVVLCKNRGGVRCERERGRAGDECGRRRRSGKYRAGPGKGPLSDPSAEGGEQAARMEFFAGAIGTYKNPHSHRDMDLNDPAEAIEIILLAHQLLRIVDARGKVRSHP